MCPFLNCAVTVFQFFDRKAWQKILIDNTWHSMMDMHC